MFNWFPGCTRLSQAARQEMLVLLELFAVSENKEEAVGRWQGCNLQQVSLLLTQTLQGSCILIDFPEVTKDAFCVPVHVP